MFSNCLHDALRGAQVRSYMAEVAALEAAVRAERAQRSAADEARAAAEAERTAAVKEAAEARATLAEARLVVLNVQLAPTPDEDGAGQGRPVSQTTHCPGYWNARGLLCCLKVPSQAVEHALLLC